MGRTALTPADSKTGLEYDIDKIKGMINEIATTYLIIAYNIWEISHLESFKQKGYSNIVDFCTHEFGFKKSTTYNFINIVKKFGSDESGTVSYLQLMKMGQYSYSTLTEMLSLSDNQITGITPKTTVKQIRDLKKEKVQTSGKNEVVDVDSFVIAEKGIEPIPEPAPEHEPKPELHQCWESPSYLFQTSGKILSLELSIDEFKKLKRFLDFCNDNSYYVDFDMINAISERIESLTKG